MYEFKKFMDFNMFNIIHSMHCDYHHPHTPTNANNFYIITNHPYICTLLHVSVISLHPQGDINRKEYKINTPIYIYTMLNNNGSYKCGNLDAIDIVTLTYS